MYHVQSELCENSHCANMVVPNRASLRSSKWHIETGKTSSSRCSQRQKKSRENSAATRKLLKACVLLKEVQDSNRIMLENTRRKLDEYEEREKEMAVKLQSLCDEEMVCKETLERAMDKYTRREECLKYCLSELNRLINCSSVDDLP